MTTNIDDLVYRVPKTLDLAHQEKWDRRYLAIAKLVSTFSKDPSTQVGAVLVTADKSREFIGYNGFPKRIPDKLEWLNDRSIKYEMVVHAEENCLIKAGDLARGATLYVYPSFAAPPICSTCAKHAIQQGIAAIVGFEADENDPRTKRWKESIGYARMMFEAASIPWRMYKEI